ncbi:unnamed protein product [Meganyctiphanes norvegica]|uniref:Uncharacterized protein n=1 Tax=Meganyctiphanes norvegica TaxID=48144 RepID=A0AAV2R6P9_MEGNR
MLQVLSVFALFSALQCTTSDCPCDWVEATRTLDCENKGIYLIPTNCWDQYTDIRKVSFHENALMSLSSSDFTHSNLQNLTEFTASVNNIQSIDGEVFNKMKNLHWLDLSYNHLTSLPEYTIKELHQLQFFDISYNSIDLLGLSMFYNITKLKVFNMNYNFISELPNLESLTELNRLSAPYNRIESVPSLTHMENLEYLNFNFNEITEIPSIFIPASSNTMDIHLSKNRFMLTIFASSVLPAPSESSVCLDEALTIYATQEEADEMMEKNWKVCHDLNDAIVIVP